MKQLKQSITALFSFTPKENRGLVVLTLLLIIVLVLRVWSPFSNSSTDEVYVQFDTLFADAKVENQLLEEASPNTTIAVVNKTLLVDPNTASVHQLKQVGFSAFAAKNIVSYREKGGFYSALSSLNKIYGVDSLFLYSIEEQLVFKVDNVIEEEVLDESSDDKISLIEINNADSKTLEELPGIGSALGQRITKYRDLLGGFYSVAQVQEVYGIDSACYYKIKGLLFVDTTLLVRLNLNTALEEELNRHPYISKYQARSIIKYRELMGEFKNTKPLTQNYIFTNQQYEKVYKYFETENKSLSDN